MLVDASSENATDNTIRVLLTIDLTQSVADEAVRKNANFIMAYHPFIFRGLKSITYADPQQRSLIKLIKHNISVYCPHTAVDSAFGGVNDFLADGITKGYKEYSRDVIQPDSEDPKCGMGRIVVLDKPASLSYLIQNVKESLGLSSVQVAPSRDHGIKSEIKTIAICAGSGGSVFKGVAADLYYTGELSHHEALYLSESGLSVISCNHSNTERPFLEVIKKQLSEEIPGSEIIISETDKDPFELY